MPDTTTPVKLTTAQKFGQAAVGLGGLADIFSNPTPGKTITDQFTEQDLERFIQNLTNTFGLTNTSSQINTQGAQTGTQRYDLDPATRQFINQLMGQYSQLAQPVDLRGYQAGQIQGINRNADLQQQALRSNMASRGLSGSPVSAVGAGNVDNQRFQSINQFNASLPLLGQQLQTENLGAALSFMNAIPKDITTSTESVGQQSNVGQTSTVGQSSQQQNERSSADTKTHGTQEIIQPKESTLSRILRGVGTIGGTAASIFSDERLKEDIHPIEKATDVIMKLRPVEWNWKRGVVAQDLEKVLPDLVHNDPTSGFKKVNYTGLIPYLVSAVQELKQEVTK